MSSVPEKEAAGSGRLVARELLQEHDLSQMYRLLSQHFEGVTPAQFQRDLSEKNWVILLEKGGRFVGFSTLLVYETSIDGEIYSVVYSGDTIVAAEGWNASTLPRTWIASVAQLRKRYPRGPYLWLLITSGFRTYRFLPLFWREFFPRFDSQTPSHWKRLTDLLAGERFGRAYDARTGVVHFHNPQRLRPPLATVPAGRQRDSHVTFFLSSNPGHEQGDELVCFTELSPHNLTPAGRRMAAGLPPW
ncbi:MAG TPA: GNAT family N-acetyltransferase [Candidatus Acidoferrum sp.]|nr:GNAT family N-acetyltransferase [Candidatus Acidoferrum sp.]